MNSSEQLESHMRVLSKKLQVGFLCKCGKRFTKVYRQKQINSRNRGDSIEQYVYVRCPKCDEYTDVVVNIEIE